MDPVLNLEAIAAAAVRTEPYPYLMGEGALAPGAGAEIGASFPDIRKTGFHPSDELERAGAFGRLIDELQGEALGAVLSDKFGQDFNALPQLITVRKLSAAHEGRIHTDGEKKVMSLLIYLNDAWESPDGRFRVLRDDKAFDDYVQETAPTTGAFVAFMRGDRSWHGHTPFVGERRVVQVAWLRSQADVDRKKRTHGLSAALKSVFARAG